MLVGIVKDCYWLGATKSETQETVPGLYKEEIALAVVEYLAKCECDRLNNGEGDLFRYQPLGDQYDVAVLLWRGEDYNIVTGYKLVPMG